MVGIATDATPTHWAFCFQDSGLPLSINGPWSGLYVQGPYSPIGALSSCTNLHRSSFQLSGKVVTLQLDNRTAKAHLCNDGGAILLFLPDLLYTY